MSTAPGSALLRDAREDLTPAGDVMQIALRLIGPVLLGLALLSIRGRVKRRGFRATAGSAATGGRIT